MSDTGEGLMRKVMRVMICVMVTVIAGCGAEWFPSNGGGGPSPNPLPPKFIAQTNLQADTVYTSNTYTVAGLPDNTSTSISVSGVNDRGSSKYIVKHANGTTDDATASIGTVVNGDIVSVQHTSANSVSAQVTSTLIIGGASVLFQTTTGKLVFPTQYATSGQPVAFAVIPSDFPTSGENPIGTLKTIKSSAGNGDYSLDGTNYFSDAEQSIAVGKTIYLRHTASSSPATTTATITGTTGAYTITFMTKPSQ